MFKLCIKQLINIAISNAHKNLLRKASLFFFSSSEETNLIFKEVIVKHRIY